MDIKTQLIVFLFSFLFGFLFFYLMYINYQFIKNKNKLTQFIENIVFVLDMDLIYLFILYKINYGAYHIYFFIMTLIGSIVGYLCLKFVKGFVKYCFQKMLVLKSLYRG